MLAWIVGIALTILWTAAFVWTWRRFKKARAEEAATSLAALSAVQPRNVAPRRSWAPASQRPRPSAAEIARYWMPTSSQPSATDDVGGRLSDTVPSVFFDALLSSESSASTRDTEPPSPPSPEPGGGDFGGAGASGGWGDDDS